MHRFSLAEDSSPPSTDGTDQTQRLDNAVATIASMLRPEDDRLSPEEVDVLQRLSLDRPDDDVLSIVLGPLNLTKSPAWLSREQWDQRWAVLLKGMALCAGMHNPTISLGEALAMVGWAEDRFTLMMEANDEAILTFVEWASSDFADAEQVVNWDDVRRLLFKSGGHARQIRLRIANDYFRTIYALRRGSS
ncbi:hypothetical protein CRI94_08785 [Longibacter salinarum]|uniref:Uncharacterized protein n=2 Tax=Longibacter salinarum TaxID=1850348 RepID=A0A2A8CXR1_9BACT|nr:hypothetical protein CRI94_08785 [Longibacter salinarum]